MGDVSKTDHIMKTRYNGEKNAPMIALWCHHSVIITDSLPTYTMHTCMWHKHNYIIYIYICIYHMDGHTKGTVFSILWATKLHSCLLMLKVTGESLRIITIII